jgi:hypothetical protein
VSFDPDLLVQPPAIDAGIAALANRNMHHLEQMGEDERQEAIEHWRALVMEVLSAARVAVAGLPGEPEAPPPEGLGRAVVVFEDVGDEGITANVSFTPDLEHLDNGEVAGTPAQITALSMLQSLSEDGLDAE